MPSYVYVIVALGAYLLGSIPSGYIAGLCRGVDLRKEGSGNIGATNALRVLGKKWGYAVFVADLLKGAVAVRAAFFAVYFIWPQHAVTAGIISAACVMLGHIFPVWLGFQGGKGIATAGGIIIGLFPVPVFIFGLAVWLVLFFTTRYVSVASIGAAVSLPTSSAVMMLFGWCDWRLVVIALAMCILSIWRHKPNIERLLAGTEKRFEKKRTAAQSPS